MGKIQPQTITPYDSANLEAESPAPWATFAARAFAVGPGPGFQSTVGVVNVSMGSMKGIIGNKSGSQIRSHYAEPFFFLQSAGSINWCLPKVLSKDPAKACSHHVTRNVT